MKATDLMIGDWVRLIKSSIPLLVDAIYDGEVNLVTHKGCDSLTFLDTALEPILLTPEILEKNGFISRGSGWYIIPNTPRLDMGILGFGIDDGCGTGFSLMPNGDFVFFSKYVHEIQHCLRTVHIKKEIVL